MAQQMEDYYAYLEMVGFKLGHLWGFQRGDTFLPMVHPGCSPDLVFTSKLQVAGKDIGLPI